MDDMVERVARAIWDARAAKGGPGRTLMPWPHCPEAEWCRATARAAIEAIELEAAIVPPYGKVIWHGEGADEEFELVPTSRQRVYETVIAELKRRPTD